MKKLLIIGLLACAGGCSSPPSVPVAVVPAATPVAQVAISAYLKKTLDDPASYQPVHWGKVMPFQQRDVDAAKAEQETAEYRYQLGLAKIETNGMARLNEIGDVDRKAFNRERDAAKMYIHRADSVNRIIEKLQASTDTTRLGIIIWHAFRAKNKMGALVLDSARFIVKTSGEVSITAHP